MSARRGAQRWLSPAYAWRRTVHNLPQKVAALVVAALVWLVATADRRANIEVGYDVPLEVRDTTGGAARRAVSDLPATVRVTLSGQRTRLQGLQATSVEASVDTTGAQEGSFNLPVVVAAPEGTVLRRVLPPRVQGFVDSQISRVLSVTLSAAAPPAGALPRYDLTPTSVSVTGPSRLVRTVVRVITVPIGLDAGAEADSGLVALNADSEPVTGVTMKPGSVTVRRSDLGSLPVKTVPVRLPPVPASLLVRGTVSPETVRIVGPTAVLDTIDSVSATLTYRPGATELSPRFKLPAGVQALDRVTVRLTVTARPAVKAPAKP